MIDFVGWWDAKVSVRHGPGGRKGDGSKNADLRSLLSKAKADAETRIIEQAAYVTWRKGVVVPSRKMGKQKKSDGVSALKSHNLPAADPGDVTIHRWRRRVHRGKRYPRQAGISRVRKPCSKLPASRRSGPTMRSGCGARRWRPTLQADPAKVRR
jgi:hypothetical protein